MLTGFYTPDVHAITIVGSNGTGDVYQSNPANTSLLAHRGNVCVVMATVTGDGTSGTVEVEVGTWNAGTTTFTAIQTIGYASAPTAATNSDWIFKVIGNSNDPVIGDAIRIIAGGTPVVIVRTQGQMVKVS
jgi:hypothetical protein